jgi:glutamate synthase (NADPH/NADH) large chain
MHAPTALYDPADEHDACGVGLIAEINGRPSRRVVEKGIAALKAVFHRGALNSDGKTGDGAGVMTQIPLEFFLREIVRIGKKPDPQRILGVGMMFLPRRDQDMQESCRVAVESEVLRAGCKIYGWRQVPVNTAIIGDNANEGRPEIAQLLFEFPESFTQQNKQDVMEAIERRCYVMRRRMEKRVREKAVRDFYICSLSCRTIVYKGLFKAEQLASFYPDLKDESFTSAFILFHQRFSTNTAPVWHLAQPFRTLAHNGEINTLKGNVSWMQSHEATMESDLFGDDIEALRPVIGDNLSDTGALDNAMELLIRAGRPAPAAKHVLIPPAWSKDQSLPAHHRDYFHYCNCIMSPWDGPAAITATDGRWVLAGTDRNGLRPMRYKITRDGLLCTGSESGMVPLEQESIRIAGRLGPGQVIAVDLAAGQLYHDSAIKDWLAGRHPYSDWAEHIKHFGELPAAKPKEKPLKPEALLRRQISAGFTREDLDLLLKPMAETGKEGIGSMGDDTPLGVLAKQYRGLHHFFRQRFSQVTNPPIDSLREERVMSLMTRLGNRRNILAEEPEQMDIIELDSPVLMNDDLAKLLKHLGKDVQSLDCSFAIAGAGDGRAIELRIDALKEELDAAYAKGKRSFILSDDAVNDKRAALPMVLVVSALHHHMISKGLRKQVTLIVRCGEMLDVHHLAVLIGMGATLVNPWLAEETIRAQQAAGHYGKISANDALKHYRKALDAGMLKIMAKMGIAVISSYRGGAIFEAFGLSRSLMDQYFPNLRSRISGIGLRGIESRILARHTHAYQGEHILPAGGYYSWRKDGEFHAWEGAIVKAIQKATEQADRREYDRYRELIRSGPVINIRDLLEFSSDRHSIPLEDVEPVTSIRKRFITPAMSLGALSPEAHEILAIAMNRIGAASNSGEGGEQPERFTPYANGDNANSTIKQVASGRFGVTAEYLNACEEIQIKMAQGAKPGEGGQLPGFKVTAEIAKLRHSTEGVMLISPPPHHDIYSIEDLAQLIYDLKQINPRAKVSVKLVSQAGIGTIASGVTKAYADKILISGHSGGTGAAGFSSIKHTGTPWEMGLAETHHVLMLNRLRHRVTLQTDGGIRTGRDIIIAAMLGAEEYGIGTLSLIVMGCLLVRQCQNNTCPVGVCTQDEKLRELFSGTVDKVINLMTFLAEDVRRILAKLGYRSVDELIGRNDLLYQVHRGVDDLDALDLGPLLAAADQNGGNGTLYPNTCTTDYNAVAETLDHSLLEEAEEALKAGQRLQLAYSIANTQRSVGTRLSSLMLRYKPEGGYQSGHVTLNLRGYGGQSLGAFAVQGLKIEVRGDANDYVGKGLSGGLIVARQPTARKLHTPEHTIIGNTCLFGATSGALYAAGQAGERFAVRNSGAVAVVEGAGTNACEYMTGGMVVILGEAGHNFGAGMTGGMAFVYDPSGLLEERANTESIVLHPLASAYWEELLFAQIAEHVKQTESAWAKNILERREETRRYFVQVCPKEMIEKLEYPLSDAA